MDADILRWILDGVLGITCALLSIVYRSFAKRFDELERYRENAEKENSAFKAMDAERLIHWERARDKWIADIETLKASAVAVEVALIEQRLVASEKDREGLHFWKHSVVDPYIPGAFDALKERVDKIQDYLNSRARSDKR